MLPEPPDESSPRWTRTDAVGTVLLILALAALIVALAVLPDARRFTAPVGPDPVARGAP